MMPLFLFSWKNYNRLQSAGTAFLARRKRGDRELSCPELVFHFLFCLCVFPIKFTFLYIPIIKSSTKPRHFKG